MTTTLGDSLRLARLMRMARDLEFSDETRAIVRELLLNRLGANTAATSDDAASGEQQHAPTDQDSGQSQPAPDRTAKGPRGRSTTAVSLPVYGQRTDHIELKIRQLVEAEASWELIAPLAWDLYALRPSPSTAAHVLELVFLNGTTVDAEAVLEQLQRSSPNFFRSVHAAVRAHLVVRFWREGGGEKLVSVLFRDKDEDYLQPVERLFIYQGLIASKDRATAFIYFRRYQKELLEAVQSVGSHVSLTLPRLLLSAGGLAIELGYDADARALLEQIGSQDPEHDEALALLLHAAADKSKAGRSHYAELLQQQTTARERLALLEKFLGATRGLGGFKDRNRPALNEILKNPFEWLKADPEVYSELSDLLVRNRDLLGLLPNLLDVFRTGATTFQNPLLDAALWHGPLAVNPATPREAFYRGVALLHQYAGCGLSAERSLWQARDLIIAARSEAREPLPYDWKDLHKAATAWIAKNHYLNEPERQRMLLQLKIVLDPATVITSDVEEYLDHTETPPVAVLAKLERLAEAKAAPALECRLILKRAQLTHLSNNDLNRLWQLANARKESDLAWRVATVLHARQALAPSVRHAWEISGERRSSYEFVPPSKQAVDRCLKGFDANSARLAVACMHVGPVLPELLAILDDGAKVMRASGAPSDSIEGAVDRMLAGLSWLATPKRRYLFSTDAALGSTAIPAFMQKLPTNPWSILVARLAERLGANAFGFKLSHLQSLTQDIFPRVATRQDLRKHSGKVAKWLKELSADQRAAWSDLTQLTRLFDDAAGQDALSMFLCRLATLMFQNHHMALTSLHAMRAQASLIWDLEQFIVGEAYTDLRRKLETHSRVLVPNSLQRLTTIVAEPEHDRVSIGT